MSAAVEGMSPSRSLRQAGGICPPIRRFRIQCSSTTLYPNREAEAKHKIRREDQEGLEPVVLHRQADEGLTIIEKFEKHSDVGYAFILLTPDDVAYPAFEEASADKLRHREYRARPNVIFEFGYFVGKLGRSRVCCLYTGNVALPSDVSGMIYKRYEKSIEEVAYAVIKDLKASGYAIA